MSPPDSEMTNYDEEVSQPCGESTTYERVVPPSVVRLIFVMVRCLHLVVRVI